MPQYAENPQTGERFWLNPESNSWEALQKAENKQTGESFVLWHDEWVPEKAKPAQVEKPKTDDTPLEQVPQTPMVEAGRPQIQGAGIMRSEQSKQNYISDLQRQLVDAQTFGDRAKANDLMGRIKVASESQMAEQPDVFDEAIQKERGITDEPAGPAPQSLEQAQAFERMGAKKYRTYLPKSPTNRRSFIESARETAKIARELEEIKKPSRNILEQGVGSLASGMYNLAGGAAELLNDVALNNVETYWNAATTKARAALTGDKDSKKQLNDWAGQLFDKKGEAYEALWSTKLKRKQEESRETLEKESVQAEPLLVEYEKGKYKANWEAFKDPKFYVKVTIENAPQLALSAATGAKAFQASINAGMSEAEAISAAAKAAGSVEAAQIFTDSYNELRSNGLDQFRAFSGATIAAGIGYGVSRGIPGMGGLIKRAAGKNLLIRKGAQVLEEGFEGAFFENLVKSRKTPVRMLAGAAAEGGEEALQTVGEIAGQAAAEGKMPTATEAGAKIAGAAVGGATLGGLMSARRLRGDGSWTDAERQAVMERLQAGFGATPKASPVERVKVQIQGIDAELNDLKAGGGNQKRIELLERKKAVMESAIAGLPGGEETTVVSEVAAPLALTDEDLSLEIFNTDNTLSNFEPSQKLEDTFETLRSEADLAALEYQEIERSLAPVIRSGETQYATEEEVAAGVEAQQRLVAARRERDNTLKAVRKRLESVVNPMAEKEYNEAYETGMLKPESVMLPDVEFQAPLATVPVRIRTEGGIEQTDLTGDLATEYQEEEANHNALVDQIRNSRGYTSSERASALKEEGERFRQVKMGIIERANQVAPVAVEPTIEQGVEDVGPQGSIGEVGTAPEPGPGIPVGGEVEAPGEVRPEAGDGTSGDVARWFARVGEAFPSEAPKVARVIEQGGEVSITQNAEGNTVYTLRYETPFSEQPAYWIMVDAETPVYINTVQYLDDDVDGNTLRVLYIKAKEEGKKVATKAYRQAAQAAIEDGLVVDTMSGITISYGSFLARMVYPSSAFRTGDSVMTTDINDVLTDNFDPTYDREIAKQAFTAHNAGHSAVAQNLIEQSKAGLDTVYGQAFEVQPGTWENTKQALRNMTRGGMAESLGLQSVYDLVAAIVKDLGVLAKNGYLANRDKIAAWLAQNGNGVTIETMSQALGSEEALASIFDQKVVINPAKAFETVDSILEASGVKSLSGRIGFYATPEDAVAAATEAIGGLGNTQTQTAAKIRAKWRDIPPAIAVRIASQLHTFHTPSAPTPLELESNGKPEDSAEKEMAATAKAVDKGIDEPIGSELLKTTVPVGQVGQRMPNEQALNELRDRTFKGRFRKTMFQIGGKAPLAVISSPVSYVMRSPLMGNLRRSIRQFVAEINKVKFSQRDLLHELLTLARDPEKNNRLGLALGLASYRPYTDKKGRKKVGKMFSREELAVLFPDMSKEERELYYRVSLAMRQLTTDRMRALEVQRKAHEQTAAERMAAPGTTASQRKAILKELVSYRRAFGERMRHLGNQGYWPSSRYGNFMWRAYDQNENQIAVVFTDEDGENGAAQAVEKLKYAALQSGVVQSAIDNGTVRWNIKSPDGTPYPLPKLTDDIKGEGGLPFDLSTAKWTLQAQRLGDAIGLSDEAGTALELAISQTYLKDSIRAHEQYRTGEPGWETDALRVFQNHVSIVANEIANNKHAKEISDALEKLSFKKLGQQYDPALEEEARKQVRAAKAPPFVPNWSQYLLTLGYVYQLGGVVSVAAQQLSQIPTVGWVTLGNFYGGAQAGKAYGAGLRVASSMVDWLSLEDFSGKSRMYIKGRIDRIITWDKLRWFAGDTTKQQQDDYVTAVRNALMRAFDTGSLQPKMSAEMLQAEMRPGPTQTAADLGVETLGYVMNKFERVNRIATVVASAMLASKHGAVKFYGQNGGWALEKVDLSTTEGAEEIAATSEEFNAAINFTGGRGDLAPYQRIGGKAGAFSRPMFQFTRFPLDFFVLMHNLGLSNWRKADAAGKSRIWAYAKPQLKGLVVTSILAGPSAYWLIAMINALLSSLGAEDEMRELEDDSRLWLRGHFAKIGESIYPGDATKAADFAAKAVFTLEHGVPNAAGMDIHNSLKFQLIQAPNSAGILATIGYKAAGPFAGPLIDTIETAGKSNWEIQWKTGRKLVPRVARNLTDAVAGNVTIEGQPLDLTYYERALKAMSFTTTKEGRIYQQSGLKFDLVEDRDKTIKEGKVKSDKINALQLKYEAAATDDEKKKIDAEMQKLSEEKNKLREEWNTRNMRFIERGLARRIKAAEMRKRSSYGRKSIESYKINAAMGGE